MDLRKPIVATCGSGITACVVSFAANLINKEVPVYDVRVTVVTLEWNSNASLYCLGFLG